MKAGWVNRALGEVCHVYQPQTLSQKELKPGPYPVYGANGQIGWHDKYNHESEKLLLGCRGSVGSVHISPPFSWVNGNAMVVEPQEEIVCREYLRYALIGGVEIRAAISGAAQPQITRQSLNPIPISLPTSISEQRRIVALLDEAFADIATAKANAEKNLQNARDLLESHLQAAFTQQAGWELKTFGELAEFRNGINFNKSSKGNEIKIVGVRDFQKNFWAPLDDLETIIPDGEIPASDLIETGDLLFVRSNGNPELIGRSLLIGDLHERITHSGFTIKARLRGSELSPIYLCHYLKSGLLRREMIEGGNGANIKSLNQGTLSRLKIAFPDKSQQQLIVEQLESVQAEIAELESIYGQKLTALDDLKKSLLHQAFSGQL